MAINVLHVYKTYSTETKGGIEEVLKQLCSGTSRLDVNNRIVCLSATATKSQIITLSEASIYVYPLTFEVASCGFSWTLWKNFKTLSEWADIIHYQFPWPFGDLLALVQQAKSKPYIVSYQSDIIRQKYLNKLYSPLMKRFLANASAVVATSPAYKQTSEILRKLSQVDVIPNGIASNLANIDFSEEKKEYLQKFGNDFFLFIGVFRYYKGLDFLLSAAKNTTTPILIAGDGPLNQSLREFVEKNKLKHVHFLGQITEQEKYALLDLAKALILPSSFRSEAFGMVLLESARQSCPMISTELGTGTSYLNLDQQTGYVVEAQNAQALADAMNQLAQQNEKRNIFGIQAKQWFLENFTAETMAMRYRELYQSILDNNNSH